MGDDVDDVAIRIADDEATTPSSAGAEPLVVEASLDTSAPFRLGHATAAETLDTYAHLWPDSEDRTRNAVDTVLRRPTTAAPAIKQAPRNNLGPTR